jgi:RNA-directed DNA polymerase
VAKQQPRRRFTLLYDKVCRGDILQEAWQTVKSNKGAAGVDRSISMRSVSTAKSGS